jgi:hypothetical protein
MRRLSAAVPVTPSGAPASPVAISPNSTPRRFRILNAFATPSHKSDSEEDTPKSNDDSGEDDDTGTQRRRGLSFRRVSQKKDKPKMEPEKDKEREKEKEKREKEEHNRESDKEVRGKEERSMKMKRSGSFVVMGTRLDKKNDASPGPSRKRIPVKDDSDTKPAVGTGKARARSFQSQSPSSERMAPPSGAETGCHDVVDESTE